jgi:glycosyltransferase involved in cell wall biosynthesis
MTAIRYPPAPGGAEDHVHEVVNHLVDRGHDVVVYTSDMWKEHPFERMTEAHASVDGVTVVRKRTYQMTQAIHYPFMPGMNEMLGVPADLVHAHSFGYYHTNIAALRKRLSGTPLVITPHYHPPETMQGGFARHQLRKVYDAHVANWVFEQADAILFNTHAELASMSHHIEDMSKTHVIPNGLHTHLYEDLPDPAPFREKRGIEGPMVLYLGRLASNKRMELVINALPRILQAVPDLKLVIAGPDDGVGDDWKALTQSLGLEDVVRFEGFLSEEDKLAAFTAADLFVLPSEWEAFGLVLMEAQACGTPCVVSDRGGPKEVIAPGQTGVVVPFGDADRWTTQLMDLLTDDGLRQRMGKAARERAMTVFKWSNIIDQIEAIYGDVTGM